MRPCQDTAMAMESFKSLYYLVIKGVVMNEMGVYKFPTLREIDSETGGLLTKALGAYVFATSLLFSIGAAQMQNDRYFARFQEPKLHAASCVLPKPGAIYQDTRGKQYVHVRNSDGSISLLEVHDTDKIRDQNTREDASLTVGREKNVI